MKDCLQAFYTDASKLPKDEFDLVASHLVTQHINSKDLNEQIALVLPSMKKKAVFAMQFFLLDEGQKANEDMEAQKLGGVGHTQSNMQKIITDNGGKILKWGNVISFNELPGKPKWQVVHFGKTK